MSTKPSPQAINSATDDVRIPSSTQKIEKLIEGAIPVKYAKFHAAVDNADGTPENYFSETSNTPSRNVQIWASYAYLICLHKGQYLLVPLSNVIYSKSK
jgi:hypothetical protein